MIFNRRNRDLFEEEAERIAAMPIGEVEASLRSMGEEPIQSVPEGLKRLLATQREIKTAELSRFTSAQIPSALARYRVPSMLLSGVLSLELVLTVQWWGWTTAAILSVVVVAICQITVIALLRHSTSSERKSLSPYFVVLFGILLAATVSDRSALYTTADSVSSGASANGMPTETRARVNLAIWNDLSTSHNAVALQEVLPGLLEDVRKNSSLIANIDVVHFAGHAWNSPPESFSWGAPPYLSQQREAYPTLRSVGRRRYEEQIRAKQLQAEYDLRVEFEMVKLRSYLSERREGPSTCSDLEALQARMIRQNTPFNILITDGWAGCRNEGANRRHNFGGRLIILILPTGGDRNRSTRIENLKAIFPQAEILVYYQSARVISTLLQENLAVDSK